MVAFIAGKIAEAREVSLTAGQAKYRAYFVDTKLWVRYKADVNTILEVDGMTDCIVTE